MDLAEKESSEVSLIHTESAGFFAEASDFCKNVSRRYVPRIISQNSVQSCPQISWLDTLKVKTEVIQRNNMSTRRTTKK